MSPQSFGDKDAKRSLYAAYLLRIYLSLNNLGFSVSLPVITARYDALEWFAVILVVGSTASTIVSAFAGRFTIMLGRKRAALLFTVGTAVTSLFCAFAGSLSLFIAGYFFMNLFYGVASTCLLYTSEMAASIPGTTVRMAIAAVGILPIIIIYPFVQNNFVKGIAVGAVKG